MSAPPQLRALTMDDLAAPARALALVNGFASNVGNALGGGLSFGNFPAVDTVLDVTMPARWLAPTLLSSWANADTTTYDAAGYRKDADGRVWLRGVVSGGTYGTSPIFTLPAAYRPAKKQRLPVAQSSLMEPAGEVDVLANGNVIAPDITSVQSGTSSWLTLGGSFESTSSASIPPGAPFPLYITTGALTKGARGLWALSCMDMTSGTAVEAPLPTPAWSAVSRSGGSAIRITDLPGLLPERRYRVRVVVLGF